MRHELDVITFTDRVFSTRKFGFIDSDKAHDIFTKTVEKFKSEDKKVLITLRVESFEGYFTLVNSYLHDPKRPIETKVHTGSKK